MQIIKSIRICNFRSIDEVKLDVSAGDLCIIVGNNDAGKSNILRALNLFFNGETDIGSRLNFERDFWLGFETGRARQKKITIELEIIAPQKFLKGQHTVLWRKEWKEVGPIQEKMILQDSNGKTVKFSAKSKLPTWINKIIFRYVPAIKGREYFNYLMGSLNDVLSESYKDRFRKDSRNFIKGVQEITQQITKDLSKELGIENRIQVPSDFKPLFSSLDFGTEVNGNSYPLSMRGDGIKIRHVPIILHFMAMSEKQINRQGYMPSETIWGFEEPENNLEMAQAFQLAKSFLRFSEDIQIFLTTHSPAFYSLNKSEHQIVKTFFVSRGKRNDTVARVVQKKTTEDASEQADLDLDDQMGVLPYITKFVEAQTQKLLSEKAEREAYIKQLQQEIHQLGDHIKCLVFTEDHETNMLEALLKSNGYEMQDTKIRTYENKNQLDYAIFMADQMITYDKRNLAKIIFHQDSDVQNDAMLKKYAKGKLKKHQNFEMFYTDGYDIEGYFLNADHINYIFPQISKDRIEQLIDKATKDMEDVSLDKLTNTILENKKGKVNYRKTYNEILQMYHSNVKRYRYGKDVLDKLISYVASDLQQTGVDVREKIITPSEFLIVKRLQALKQEIWPETKTT
ncbi:MAG: AAA family ATPase [Calditrichaeota bacterium]|nr:AAA family ATPase [Calditrichota bacterium]